MLGWVKNLAKRAGFLIQTTLSDPRLSSYWFGISGKTDAGVAVDEDSALGYSAVWAAVNAFASSLAQMPCGVYRDDFVDPEHPLDLLLGVEPNPEMSSAVFFETLAGHYETYGNAYAEVQRDRSGKIIALWPLLPNLVTPSFDETNSLYYSVSPGSGVGQSVPVAPKHIIHIPWMSFDGREGYSPIKKNAEAVGLGTAANKSAAKFFGKGMKTDFVLEHPGELGPEAQSRLRASFESNNSGLENHHRIPILEEGMKLNQFGKNPEESQMLQTRVYQTREVCRGWGIQPHRLADLEYATFSNIEHQSLEFIIYSLQPRLRKWSLELSRKLLTPLELKQKLRVGFDVSPLLQGDFMTLAKALGELKSKGLITTNEGRRRLKLAPVENGDTLLEPVNNLRPLDSIQGNQNNVDPNVDPSADPTGTGNPVDTTGSNAV